MTYVSDKSYVQKQFVTTIFFRNEHASMTYYRGQERADVMFYFAVNGDYSVISEGIMPRATSGDTVAHSSRLLKAKVRCSYEGEGLWGLEMLIRP